MSITHLQRDVLIFIRDYMRDNGGVSPTYEEIRVSFGMRSKSNVARIICRLEERGFLKRKARKARSIKIIKVPAETAEYRVHKERSADIPAGVIDLPIYSLRGVAASFGKSNHASDDSSGRKRNHG